ncbi:MAG TPA: N-acetylglucosamine-6-phosphate deacetylase [Chondromyces sp.]|nr:N-acetylglucosamine-6-phosphate deacetylase [Chondromyces sp.]
MLKSNRILIKGMSIYTEDGIIESGYIRMENGLIQDIGTLEKLDVTSPNEGYTEIQVPSHYRAIPGFIDIHIHGAAGADTMDATKEALDTMAAALPKEGTTSFLATTITQDQPSIERALVNAGEYINGTQLPGQAEILGVHLEGPFINANKAGAQPVQHILDAQLSAFQKWQSLSKNTIRLVTLAPECPGGYELIQYLKEEGIVASIGHSDATYEQVRKAIDAGASQVTHLFNQMRGLHHREPGVAGAALLHDELKAEIIADGIHVRPEMIKLAYQQKGRSGLILITDAMRAKCLKNGTYDLGGQDVTVKDGKAVLSDGTLAGSVLHLDQAVQNILSFTDCSLESAIEMAAVNPAKQLGVFDRKGSITIGKDADVVIVTDENETFMTFCRGELAYHRGEESYANN